MENLSKLNVKQLYKRLCPKCREVLINQIKEDLVDQQVREQLEEKD